MEFAFREAHTSIVLRIALLLSLLWTAGLAVTRSSAPQPTQADPELQAVNSQGLRVAYTEAVKDNRIEAPAPPSSFTRRTGFFSFALVFGVMASLASVLAFYRILR